MDLANLRIMNAAGWCKTIDEVEKLARTPVTEITIGSITIQERAGNEEPTFWQSDDGTYALNSRGLPNPGIEKVREWLPRARDVAQKAGKRLRVNIAGFKPTDYAYPAYAVAPYVDTIELNLGCPNIWGAQGQKPIMAFKPKLIKEVVLLVAGMADNHRPRIAVKVSPYSDPQLLTKIALTLKELRDFVDEVVTSNTFPNAFAFSGEKAAISGGGFAGMSGNAMKAIALGQAIQFRSILSQDDFAIVGVGGITTGQDILDYMRGGVTSVQVGTHYFLHGAKVFSELLQECV